VGVTGGWFSTELELGGGEVSLSETTVMAAATYQRSPSLGFELGLGAVLDGEAGDHEGDVSSGAAASAAVTWLALYEGERRPFVLFSLSLAGSRTDAVSDDGESHALSAFDARVGAMVGKTFGPATPYAVARVFGGPVSWRLGGDDVSGGDAHHYTVGAGASIRIARRLNLAAEAMAIGERSATLSAALGL
jgi:opacity protein-like surface antigen